MPEIIMKRIIKMQVVKESAGIVKDCCGNLKNIFSKTWLFCPFCGEEVILTSKDIIDDNIPIGSAEEAIDCKPYPVPTGP